jgi:hypothetical protein
MNKWIMAAALLISLLGVWGVPILEKSSTEANFQKTFGFRYAPAQKGLVRQKLDALALKVTKGPCNELRTVYTQYAAADKTVKEMSRYHVEILTELPQGLTHELPHSRVCP